MRCDVSARALPGRSAARATRPVRSGSPGRGHATGTTSSRQHRHARSGMRVRHEDVCIFGMVCVLFLSACIAYGPFNSFSIPLLVLGSYRACTARARNGLAHSTERLPQRGGHVHRRRPAGRSRAVAKDGELSLVENRPHHLKRGHCYPLAPSCAVFRACVLESLRIEVCRMTLSHLAVGGTL